MLLSAVPIWFLLLPTQTNYFISNFIHANYESMMVLRDYNLKKEKTK